MSAPLHFFAAEASQSEILYIISRATVEGKVIIAILAIFSVFAWSVMASKAWQMRQAKISPKRTKLLKSERFMSVTINGE